MQLITKYLISTLLFISLNALSQTKGDGYEFQANKNTITILFVNGITNDAPKAALSSDVLMSTLYRSGLQKNKYNHAYYWNPTEGFVKDNNELKLQAKISDQFYKTNKSDYYAKLGQYYNQTSSNGSDATLNRIILTSTGLKNRIINILNYSTGIIIVPHSQGNFYTESAYAMLIADGRADLTNRIRVVGVASVAASTPNDRYITSSTDKAIISQQTQTSDLKSYSTLSANQTPCIGNTCGSDIDWHAIDDTGHGFLEVYTNFGITNTQNTSFPDIIYAFVSKSIEELNSVPVSLFEVSSSPKAGSAVTFTSKSTTLNGNISNTVWNFGDNIQSSSGGNGPVQHTYITAGNYTVTLTVTDSTGKTATSSQTIVVAPAASATFINNEISWRVTGGTAYAYDTAANNGYKWFNLDNISFNLKTGDGFSDLYKAHDYSQMAWALFVSTQNDILDGIKVEFDVRAVTPPYSLINPGSCGNFTFGFRLGNATYFVANNGNSFDVINSTVWKNGNYFPPGKYYIKFAKYSLNDYAWSIALNDVINIIGSGHTGGVSGNIVSAQEFVGQYSYDHSMIFSVNHGICTVSQFKIGR